MKKNYILVSSVTNGRDTSYPAAFPCVIGINSIVMQNNSEYWYSKQAPIQCVSDVTPVMVPNLDGSYRMFGGNSKAAAHFSGVLLNILAKNPFMSFDDINNILELNSIKNNWTQDDIINGRNINNFRNHYDTTNRKASANIIKVIIEVIASELNLKEDIIQNLGNNLLLNILGADDFYKIIKTVFKFYDLDLNYKEIEYQYFLSIYTLCNYIEDQIRGC